jgi:hypothetical protein
MNTFTLFALVLSIIYTGSFFYWILFDLLHPFFTIVLTHNLAHFIGFWCGFFTLWSGIWIAVKFADICKRSARYRDKDLKLSFIVLLMFFGAIIFADAQVFPLLFP